MTSVAAALPRRRSLGRIMTSIAPVSLAVQIASFASSLALARILGATTSTDAYYLGLSIPFLTYGLLMSALRNGAIPSLTEAAAASGNEGLRRVAGELLTGVMAVSLLLTLLVMGVAQAVLGFVLDGRVLDLTRLFMLELAPYTILGAVTGVLGAVLAVRAVFIVPVAVMMCEPVVKAGLTIALGHQIGVQSLILGNLIGSGLAVAVLWWMLRRQGLGLRIGRPFNTPFVRKTARISIPLIASSSILLVNPVIDRTMASALGSGSVTALELGLRLLTPFGLVTGLLIGPLVATWSVRKADGGWPAIQASATAALNGAAVVLPPLVVLGVTLRGPLVSLLFKGGAYPADALHETTSVFGMILLGLPAEMLILVIGTIFLVEGDTIFAVKIAAANVVLNIGLNFIFRPILGAAGIALSTSITLTLLMLGFAVTAHRRWGALYVGRPWTVGLRLAASIGLMVGAAEALLQALPTGGSRAGAVVVILVVGGAGLAVHAAVLTIGRDPIALAGVSHLRRIALRVAR